jgi:hypothetical protein
MKLKNFNEQNKDRELKKRDSVFGQAKRTYGWTPVYCVMDNVMNYYTVVFMAPF